MSTLLSTLAGILRLRLGPQDLPASWNLTVLMVTVYLGLGMFTGRQQGDEHAATTVLVVTALQFAAVTLLLYLSKRPERLPQTLCALAGTGAILGLLSFMILSQMDPAQEYPVLTLAWFSVFFWSLVVDGHIYRHALSITMPQGLLVAVLLLAASFILVEFALK